MSPRESSGHWNELNIVPMLSSVELVRTHRKRLLIGIIIRVLPLLANEDFLTRKLLSFAESFATLHNIA